MIERMNLSEFTDFVASNIKEYMPDSYHDAQVKVERVLKDGDEIYSGLSLRREGENQYPRVYLEGSFHDYLNGKDLQNVMKDLAQEYCDARGMGFMADRANAVLANREEAIQHLSFRLVNRESNRKNLQHRPYREMADLALIYSVELGAGARLPVDHNVAAKLDLTEDGLYKAALLHSPEVCPVEIQTVGEALGMGRMDSTPMLVISNTEHADGASAILYPGVADGIRDRLDGDFYLLPASVHEMLAIPKEPERLADLKDMVRQVNQTIVDARETLSDQVYEHTGSGFAIARDDGVRELTHPTKSTGLTLD